MFKNILRRLANRYLSSEVAVNETTTLRSGRGLDSNHGLNLSLHKANGGIIVETYAYDSIKDRSYRNLHIVTDEDDLGNNLSKIITMELLRV